MQAALPWFKHNSAPNYHSSTPWPWWDRERIRSEETYGFFMKTVIKKRKKKTQEKAKQGMHPALPISRQVVSNSQESRGSITHNNDLGRKKLSLQTPWTLPWCMLRVMTTMTPPDYLGSAVLPLSPPKFLCTRSLLRWGEKCLILCRLCSAIMTTSLCYQHWFSKNSKHISMVDIMKEIKSTPDKTSTCMSLHPKCRSQFPMRVNRRLLEKRCILKVTL